MDETQPKVDRTYREIKEEELDCYICLGGAVVVRRDEDWQSKRVNEPIIEDLNRQYEQLARRLKIPESKDRMVFFLKGALLSEHKVDSDYASNPGGNPVEIPYDVLQIAVNFFRKRE